MHHGGRRRAGGRWPAEKARASRPTLRDRVDDLQQEIESLTEDIEDLGEPVEEFELFDQCAYTIGVTQYGSWGGDTGFLFGREGAAPAGARDGHARVRHTAVRLPGLPRRGATEHRVQRRRRRRIHRQLSRGDHGVSEAAVPGWGRDPLQLLWSPSRRRSMLAWAGPAQAKRLVGTKGPNKLVGTAKSDVVKGLGAMTESRAAVAGIDSLEGAAPIG